MTAWPSPCYDCPVHSLTRWVLTTFTTPLGVFVLAALDSTVFFSVPFGIDAAVIILAAHNEGAAWVVPLVAAVGSMAGAAATFWMGVKIGDKGLERFVAERRLRPIRHRIEQSGAIALAVADLIPPPFPFTAVVLAAGALEVSPTLFFGTLFVTRLVRFGIEALLAFRFGKQILSWIDSNLVQNVMFALIVIAAGLTLFGLIRLIRPRSASRGAAA
jgi:membrane protein YqaA with SNARE-associated domain